MSNAIANGLAGAGAGIVAQILTYPLQTVLLVTLSYQFLFFFFNASINESPFSLQVNTRQQTERLVKKSSLLPQSHAPDAPKRPVKASTLALLLQVNYPSDFI